jgi:hypothetical protein
MWKDKDASYFAIVYFRDKENLPPEQRGTKFYSRDFSSSHNKIRKPELGLSRLKRMIENTFKSKYNTAIIYDAVSGETVEKYVNNVKV